MLVKVGAWRNGCVEGSYMSMRGLAREREKKTRDRREEVAERREDG